MRHIGITQRVSEIPNRGERRDCLDQQWPVLLEHLGLLAVTLPNRLANPQRHLTELELHGIILTGGNDLAHLPGASNPAPERDQTEYKALEFAAARGLPVLGVCRGLQIMNVYLGGHLVPVTGHTRAQHRLRPETGDSAFEGLTSVNSFHDWGIIDEGLARDLYPEAKADDGTIEAVRHRRLPWLGIMWHPERTGAFMDADLTLIETLFGTSV